MSTFRLQQYVKIPKINILQGVFTWVITQLRHEAKLLARECYWNKAVIQNELDFVTREGMFQKDLVTNTSPTA
jgi:hypothetical protein